MANNFDKGMDDYYSGREIKGDPGLEYLQGYEYAESLYETDQREQEQVDDREQQPEPEPEPEPQEQNILNNSVREYCRFKDAPCNYTGNGWYDRCVGCKDNNGFKSKNEDVSKPF